MLKNLFLLLLMCLSIGCGAGKIQQLEDENRKLRSELTDLRSIQAQQSTDISEIKNQLRSISGNVEEIQHVSIGKTKELEASIIQLKSRVPPPAGVPEDLLNQDDDKIAAIQGESADLYRKALSELRTGDFDAAKASLSQFIEANPGTAFTDNAIFWLGVVYEKLGQNDRAIISYSEVFQKYPAEDMVAPALFNLSEAFGKLGSKSDQIVTLQKLVDEHKATPYAQKGLERLKQLQPGGTKKATGSKR